MQKTRANSVKLPSFSDFVTPKYPKIDLTFRSFYKNNFFVSQCYYLMLFYLPLCVDNQGVAAGELQPPVREASPLFGEGFYRI